MPLPPQKLRLNRARLFSISGYIIRFPPPAGNHAMKTSDFDFAFPEELIAYSPLQRGASRMLVVDKAGDAEPISTHTRQLIDYLAPGDALVLNDTRVLRARLIASLPSGGRVEALLLKPLAGVTARWEAMVKPGKRFRVGDSVPFSAGLTATVEEVRED